jgi:hypothetical protein
MERVWGSKAFAFYYFFCVIGAGVVQLFVATQGADEGAIYPTVGASGSVFRLLLAFGLAFPNEMLMLVFPPMGLKAKWFVLIYGAIELWTGVIGTAEGVAHFRASRCHAVRVCSVVVLASPATRLALIAADPVLGIPMPVVSQRTMVAIWRSSGAVRASTSRSMPLMRPTSVASPVVTATS